MGETVGYMLTWTTYGSWLQGDNRGYVKDGKILSAKAGLERANMMLRKRDAVKLQRAEREVAKKAILAEAERIGEKVLAILVWSSHVHVVVGAGGKAVGKVVRQFKLAGYHALRKYGFEGRVWTRGYDTRFCFDEKALKGRIGYVMRHKG